MCAWALLLGLFGAFDENVDNHIDFKEMACGISACCRGPMVEKHKCKSEQQCHLQHDLLQCCVGPCIASASLVYYLDLSLHMHPITVK